MTEGAWPKADGDIFYASEANRLREKVIGNTLTYFDWNSGTNYQVVGSIYYSGTFPSLFCDHLKLEGGMRFNGDTSSRAFGLQFRCSGTLFNQTLTAGSYMLGYANISSANIILTSGTFHSWNGNFGSPFLIYFEALSPQDGNKTLNFSVTGV